jgi:hypothetical protein
VDIVIQGNASPWYVQLHVVLTWCGLSRFMQIILPNIDMNQLKLIRGTYQTGQIIYYWRNVEVHSCSFSKLNKQSGVLSS